MYSMTSTTESGRTLRHVSPKSDDMSNLVFSDKNMTSTEDFTKKRKQLEKKLSISSMGDDISIPDNSVVCSNIKRIMTESSNPLRDIDALNHVDESGTCKCSGCKTDRCNKCTLCEQSGFLFNTCVLKTCHIHHDYDEEMRNYNEILKILKNSTDMTSTYLDPLEVGTRVYACWNKKDNKRGWYWGVITNKSFTNANRSTTKEIYSITFDDGDKKQRMERQEIWSEFKFKLYTEKIRLESLLNQYSQNTIEKPSGGINPTESQTTVLHFNSSNIVSKHDEQKNGQRTRRTARKQSTTDYRNLSGVNTSKPKASNSSRRESNKDNRDPQEQNVVACSSNEQSCSTLMMPTHTNYHGCKSTEMLGSSRSIGFGTVVNQEKNSSVTSSNPLSTHSSTNKRSVLGSNISVDEWWKRGCLGCKNCQREKCNRCFLCRSSSSNKVDAGKWRDFKCFQKMCLKIPEEEKLQNAPFFPPGWKFGFTSVASRNAESKGMLLLKSTTEGNVRFRSIRSALRNMRASHVDVKSFCHYVGLDEVPDHTLDTKHELKRKVNGSSKLEERIPRRTGCEQLNDGFSSQIRKRVHVYSSKKEVGAKVYAQFTNGEWYWGVITNVITCAQAENTNKFSILYDDGEAIHNLPDEKVVTEQEYFDISQMHPPTLTDYDEVSSDASSVCSFPDSDKRVSFSLSELFLLRCNACTSCRKKDCDHCASCRDNKLSTSRNRQACYFNICEKTPNAEKAQPVPGLYTGWNFYISSCVGTAWPKSRNVVRRSFHPALEGLQIVAPDGKKIYHSMEDAAKDCGFKGEELREKVIYFYETVLGIKPRRERGNHQLIGRGYHRDWVDGTGRHREAYGVVIKCWESLFLEGYSNMLWFSVRYENETRSVLTSTSLCQLTLPEIDDNIPEHVAWGGFLSFSKKVRMTAIDQMLIKQAPFHFNWVVPTMRYSVYSPNSAYKSVILITRGYKLELEAKVSSIPNSGLGLWVKCTTASSLIDKNDKFLLLAPGEAIDLGCYAPTDNIDRRPEHVNLVKAFIHDWECESWCFEMVHHHRGNDIFDITDDLTGTLHDKAKENILVYANETDGKEIPSLFAEHDPEGSVHYYMGHRDEDYGVFRLPVDGTSIELKVDYGPKYENVRVRKGYSRLTKVEAAKVQLQLKEEDAEVLAEIGEFSAKDLVDVIIFLENLLKRSDKSVSKDSFNKDKILRTLIVSTAIYKRVANILKEFARPVANISSYSEKIPANSNGTISFCDNGYTDMRQTKAFERSRKLIGNSLQQFPSSESMKECICSNILYSSYIEKLLSLDSLGDISADVLKQKLLDAHEAKSIT